MTEQEIKELTDWMSLAQPDKQALAISCWYVRNAGCRGFGRLGSLEPRKIMEINQGKWQLLPNFTEKDIET